MRYNNYGDDTCQLETGLGGISGMVYPSGWVLDVRAGGKEVKVLPRLLFEGWSMADYQALFANEGNMKDVADFIVKNLKVQYET